VKDDLSVIMLSWEFPPRIVGGISPHIYYLSKCLAKLGVTVYVVTLDFPNAPSHEVIDGVVVYRVDSYRSPAPDFASWVYLMNINLQKETARLVKRIGNEGIDILHAHDWLVANAAIGLKHIFRKPLLVTMHSTEVGRRATLHDATERMIHETEAWLSYEAWRVICCSEYMISHVRSVFGLPNDKLVMIPNGINTSVYDEIHEDLTNFRNKFALPEEKIILYVGRLVYEKGIHVLINAAPKILSRTNAKFVIVGSGYMKEQLINKVRGMGFEHKVLFQGFMDEASLLRLQKCADVTVVPSLYEPFGIVALEAMAARSPVVVSDTGGMSEIVDHDFSGVKVYPDNSDSLAWGINKVLLDEKYRRSIVESAYKVVQEKYSWEKIAEKTRAQYNEIIDEYSKSHWL
jgi:glycosyltransferase involved in cell wall biosynthesis